METIILLVVAMYLLMGIAVATFTSLNGIKVLQWCGFSEKEIDLVLTTKPKTDRGFITLAFIWPSLFVLRYALSDPDIRATVLSRF